MNETKIVVDFNDREPKNHSIRWNASSKDSPISTMYIGKSAPLAFLGAKRIRVTVEVLD